MDPYHVANLKGEWYVFGHNPSKRFQPITVYPSETKRFTDEEIKALLTKAPDDFRDMLLFL